MSRNFFLGFKKGESVCIGFVRISSGSFEVHGKTPNGYFAAAWGPKFGPTSSKKNLTYLPLSFHKYSKGGIGGMILPSSISHLGEINCQGRVIESPDGVKVSTKKMSGGFKVYLTVQSQKKKKRAANQLRRPTRSL